MGQNKCNDNTRKTTHLNRDRGDLKTGKGHGFQIWVICGSMCLIKQFYVQIPKWVKMRRKTYLELQSLLGWTLTVLAPLPSEAASARTGVLIAWKLVVSAGRLADASIHASVVFARSNSCNSQLRQRINSYSTCVTYMCIHDFTGIKFRNRPVKVSAQWKLQRENGGNAFTVADP